jgi:xanthine dehydrogenase YagS FAD-binding subunit
MNHFTYMRATSLQETIAQLNQDPQAKIIAGGTNLLDRMKVWLDQPTQLIDMSRLDLRQIEAVTDGGWRIGALVTNTALANHPAIRQDYPILSRAILAGASPQIRNMATVGGNLMQRTRCPYYYDRAFACNKREPGSGCPAATGMNRNHAIFGASEQCVATHPSDMCVALAALDAVVVVEGTQGQREIALTDFHRLPENSPQQDNHLAPGEVITQIVLPPSRAAKMGVYLKLRDRHSYAFALVSVAALVELSDQTIQSARIALGGVAHKPWRAFEAETFLVGQAASPEIFQTAAELALQSATPLAHNGFKVTMAKRAIQRALNVAAQGGGIV